MDLYLSVVCMAELHFRNIEVVALVLQPLLSVPVSPVRTPTEGGTPPALQCSGHGLGVRDVVVLLVRAGHAALAVRVGVAGGQGAEQDGGLVPDRFLLQSQPVVLVDGLPSRN